MLNISQSSKEKWPFDPSVEKQPIQENKTSVGGQLKNKKIQTINEDQLDELKLSDDFKGQLSKIISINKFGLLDKFREEINKIDDRVKEYGPIVKNQWEVYENHRELNMHYYYAHGNPEGFEYHDKEYRMRIKERFKTCECINKLVQAINEKIKRYPKYYV